MALIHEKSLRGRTQIGWLDSHHTFSFGGWNDPSRMGHRALRVLNDDVVAPGAGFGKHGHQEMDIVTYVISGALQHGDSMGNRSVIKAGEFQHMYAGTGVMHSEMNASDTEEVHFLQIWIVPERTGGAPTYFQIEADLASQPNTFVQVAGPMQKEQQAMLRSDTHIYMARLDDGATVRKEFAPDRSGFLQVIKGMVEIEGHKLSGGDGLQFDSTSLCEVTAKSEAELMLFDLA